MVSAGPPVPGVLHRLTRATTPNYSAPELFSDFHTLSGDVWSTRVICSELLHVKGRQHNRAVHAPTSCQPRKMPALVRDLLVAGLRDANVTGSGHNCTLELPALFEPGDNHPYWVALEERTKKEVVQDPL